MARVVSLFDGLTREAREELTDVLVESSSVRIERIVSTGQASPPGYWYDQPEDEWVVLLSGSASLEFDGDSDDVPLKPGDYLNIPAHTRHRVAWTNPDEPTVWLAVFYTANAELEPDASTRGESAQ